MEKDVELRSGAPSPLDRDLANEKPMRMGSLATSGLAAGLFGLGALSVLFHDFALTWQPVPAWLPHRSSWAVVSGLLLLAVGALLAIPKARHLGAGVGAAFLGIWVIVLHLPAAIVNPLSVAKWLGVAEALAVATGCFAVFRLARVKAGKGLHDFRIVVWTFGATCVVFGVSHFAYVAFTTSMVPAWMPARTPLAFLTGAVHMLTGVCLLAGYQRYRAALVEASMMTSFVLLVHVPGALASHGDRFQMTALFFAIALTSSAWIVASVCRLRYEVAVPTVR